MNWRMCHGMHGALDRLLHSFWSLPHSAHSIRVSVLPTGSHSECNPGWRSCCGHLCGHGDSPIRCYDHWKHCGNCLCAWVQVPDCKYGLNRTWNLHHHLLLSHQQRKAMKIPFIRPCLRVISLLSEIPLRVQCPVVSTLPRLLLCSRKESDIKLLKELVWIEC